MHTKLVSLSNKPTDNLTLRLKDPFFPPFEDISSKIFDFKEPLSRPKKTNDTLLEENQNRLRFGRCF